MLYKMSIFLFIFCNVFNNGLLICFGQINTAINSLTFPSSYTTDYNIIACSICKDTTTQEHESGNSYAYTKNLTGITNLKRSVYTNQRYTNNNWKHAAWLAVGF